MIELQDIVVEYPAVSDGPVVRLFDGFSLRLDAPGIVALVGRSGSGKTTLINVAAGLLTPTEGAVLWDAQPILRMSEREIAAARRRRIGIVFQGGGLISTLTAAENVAVAGFGIRDVANGRLRALDLLAELGVATRGDHLPSELSAGERQRVGMARALFLRPDHLLVDEPTANLDRVSADDVVATLQAVASARSVLVATHDARVRAVATHVINLD